VNVFTDNYHGLSLPTSSWCPDALEILPEAGLPCPAGLEQKPNAHRQGWHGPNQRGISRIRRVGRSPSLTRNYNIIDFSEQSVREGVVSTPASVHTDATAGRAEGLRPSALFPSPQEWGLRGLRRIDGATSAATNAGACDATGVGSVARQLRLSAR